MQPVATPTASSGLTTSAKYAGTPWVVSDGDTLTSIATAVGVSVDDDQRPRSLLMESFDQRLADSAGSAGDDRDLVLELHGRAS